MKDLLEKLKYKVEIAQNGMDAIEKYSKFRPDMVLVDISMPEMNGISCIEKMADIDPDMNAVIISGYDKNSSNNSDNGIKNLIKAYLTKPVGLNELSATIAKVLHPDI